MKFVQREKRPSGFYDVILLDFPRETGDAVSTSMFSSWVAK